MQKAILSGWLFLFVLAEEQQPHGSECGCFAWVFAKGIEHACLRITSRTIISADEGVMKPGAEYYLRALQKFRLKAEECFFVDDVPANIEGALFCGITGAVFHGSASLLRRDLRAAGVNVAE